VYQHCARADRQSRRCNIFLQRVSNSRRRRHVCQTIRLCGCHMLLFYQKDASMITKPSLRDERTAWHCFQQQRLEIVRNAHMPSYLSTCVCNCSAISIPERQRTRQYCTKDPAAMLLIRSSTAVQFSVKCQKGWFDVLASCNDSREPSTAYAVR